MAGAAKIRIGGMPAGMKPTVSVSPALEWLSVKNSEGRPHRVVQHCTQLSVSFCAMKKQKATDQPRRIGFVLWENFVGDDEG